MSIVGNVFETPHNAPPDWAIMLTAYMDESSHEKGTVTLAGFIGNKVQWDSFVPEWKKGLGRQRTRLHMKELRWNNPRNERLLKNLAPIPFEAGLRPVYSRVTDSDFADLLKNEVDKRFTRTYLVALMPMLLLVIKEIPQEETIKFVFDQQLQYELFTRFIFHVLRNEKTPDGRAKLAGVEFIYQNPLTDPGDYLAFAITQITRDATSKKANWCAPIVMQLMKSKVQPIVCQPTREQVRFIIEFGKQYGEMKRK